MRVSDTRRVLFVHVQKTGGNTIDEMFDEEVQDARSVSDLRRHTPWETILEVEPELGEYWSCAFVRNPFSRMVSWWSMGVRFAERVAEGSPRAKGKLRRRPEVWEPFLQYRDSFERFVLEGTETMPRLAVPQVRLVSVGERRVDFIGRTESFVRDTNVIRDRLGLAPVPEMPRRNKSEHGHYTEYYTDATRRRVEALYEEDLDAFGYAYGR